MNTLLGKFDLRLERKSLLDEIKVPNRALTIEEKDYLNSSNPKLVDLRKRYEEHPASVHSEWTKDFVDKTIDLTSFRADSAYIYQGIHRNSDQSYLLSAYYVQQADHCGLYELFQEDGKFGAFAFEFNGKIVSRDLLDSVLEINFLAECLGDKSVNLLDIGAGYGRFAHRLFEAQDRISNIQQIYCTDAIAESSFLCEYYLNSRRSDASVVKLDEVEEFLARAQIDVVTNIHSFSECTIDSIRWWLGAVAKSPVKYLLIVPNTGKELLSTEANGSRVDFLREVESCGFRRTVMRQKYDNATLMDRWGIFPTCYHWFERNE